MLCKKIMGGGGTQRFYLLWIFLAIILLVGLAVLLWLAKFGNTPQVYTDIVLEQLGAEFANKSIELYLYWAGMAAGVMIITVLFLTGRKYGIAKVSSSESTWSDGRLAVTGLTVLITGNYIFYGEANTVLILAEIAGLFAYFFYRQAVMQTLCCYFLVIYAISGLYEIYALAGGKTEVNAALVSVAAFLTSVGAIVLANGRGYKVILLLQIPVPFLLLIYLICRYHYQGEIVIIKPEETVHILIVVVIMFSLYCILRNIWKNWNSTCLGGLISASVPMAVMSYQRFSGSGCIMLTDMHHPAENTIAFNEIANLGREVFTEYVPVSGLYGYVQGLFLEIFGKGNYTEYSIANNVYYLIICILVVCAVRLHLDAAWTFLLSVFIFISDYSRVALILPFLLVLLSKKLTEQPVLWLIVWIMCSWCYGLYYPAYGAAIVAAVLPMGISLMPKIVIFWKVCGSIQKVVYGVCLAILLGIVLASVPVLVGMAEHVLVMGDGMIYVDGVTVFGQALPEGFLGYLNTDGLLYTFRMAAGYLVRFLVPMFVVWIAFAASMYVFKEKKVRWKTILIELETGEASILACLIFPVVCFYFSLYRMGAGNLFNRAVYIIDYSLVLLIIILYEYGKDGADKYLLILMAVLACTLGNNSGLHGLSDSYHRTYQVGDEYVYVNERKDIPRLGKGFVKKDLMEQIERAAQKYQTMDSDRNYFALFSNGDHGMAYDAMLNIRGTGMLETLVCRGYSIAKDTAEKLIASNTIVGNRISPVDHYYLYRWLVTGGGYIWSEEEQVFYPVQDQTKEEIEAANARVTAGMPSSYVGRYAASLGNSVESLHGVLNENVDIFYTVTAANDNYEIEFPRGLQGNEVDYIYLLADVGEDESYFVMGDEHTATNKLDKYLMKKDYNQGMEIVISWLDNKGTVHELRASAENGKLLLPVGAGTGWLCNDHSALKIWFEQNGERIKPPEMKEMRFYSARKIVID